MQVVTFTCKTLQRGILWIIVLTGEINHGPGKDVVKRIALQSALLEDGHFTAWLLVSIDLSCTTSLCTHIHTIGWVISCSKRRNVVLRCLSVFSLTCNSDGVCARVFMYCIYWCVFFVWIGPSWFFIVHWCWKDSVFFRPCHFKPSLIMHSLASLLRLHLHLLQTEELSIIFEKNQVFLWASNSAWMHAMWCCHCCARLQNYSSWLSRLFHSSSCLIQ